MSDLVIVHTVVLARLATGDWGVGRQLSVPLKTTSRLQRAFFLAADLPTQVATHAQLATVLGPYIKSAFSKKKDNDRRESSVSLPRDEVDRTLQSTQRVP